MDQSKISWTGPKLDRLAFGRTMDRLYSPTLDQSRPPGPIVGPSGALNLTINLSLGGGGYVLLLSLFLFLPRVIFAHKFPGSRFMKGEGERQDKIAAAKDLNRGQSRC